MPIYTVAGTTTAAASSAPYATFHPVTRRAYIREMGYFTTAATATSVGMGIAANTGSVTFSTTFVPQTHNPEAAVSDTASTALLGTAWGTAPTVPTVFWRKTTLAASIGQGVIFKLAPDERIILGFTTTKQVFTFWNHGAGAGSALDMYVMYEE